MIAKVILFILISYCVFNNNFTKPFIHFYFQYGQKILARILS